MLQKFFGLEGDKPLPPSLIRKGQANPNKTKHTYTSDIGPFNIRVLSYAKSKSPGVTVTGLYHQGKKIAGTYLRSESLEFASHLHSQLSDLVRSAYRKDGEAGVFDSLEGPGQEIMIEEDNPVERAFADIKRRRKRRKRNEG